MRGQFRMWEKNISSFDLENRLKESELSSNESTKVFKYFSELQQNNQMHSGSMFFKAGFYIDQSMFKSLCTNFTDSRLKRNSSNDTVQNVFKISCEKLKYSLTFEIKDQREESYLNTLCEINDKISSRAKHIQDRLKLDYYLRFFYILEDSGGKSVYDTNKVFSVTTHEMVDWYRIEIGQGERKIIHVERRFRDFNVDYNQGHLQHYRKNLFFITRHIQPSSIGFDANYLNYLTST